MRATDRLDPDALLPLKPVEALILTMLTAGERHGYGIRQDVIAHTNGVIRLEAGTLYRHIRRLETQGLVEESARRAASTPDDERRIYYRLTGLGRRVLAAEMLRLRALLRLAEARGLVGPVRA
jgi:DNA-binding PadR family transcriptional regulator